MEGIIINAALPSGAKGQTLFTSIRDAKLETLVKFGKSIYPHIQNELGGTIESKMLPKSKYGPCSEYFVLVVVLLDCTVHLFKMESADENIFSAMCFDAVESKAVNSLMMLGRQGDLPAMCVQKNSRLYVYGLSLTKKNVHALPVTVLQCKRPPNSEYEEQDAEAALSFRKLIAKLPNKLSTLK